MKQENDSNPRSDSQVESNKKVKLNPEDELPAILGELSVRIEGLEIKLYKDQAELTKAAQTVYNLNNLTEAGK